MIEEANSSRMARMRIVSLLPSATEILFALGLGDDVVGVTHECDYPPEARLKPMLTRSRLAPDLSSGAIDAAVSAEIESPAHSLYTIDRVLLAQLAPDLIVTQALCEVCAVAYDEVLDAVRGLPHQPTVLNLEPTSLDEVLAAIEQVGAATKRDTEAEALVGSLRARIDDVQRRASVASARPVVGFLEWIDPLFCGGHWNPELVEIAGGRDPLGRRGQDAVRIEWETFRTAQPEVIVIACCGFSEERARQDLPILEAQPGYADLPAAQTGRVHVVDGAAYFSRPGPRLVDSLEILVGFVHPTDTAGY
jgi:iron complex transport system substrate-binding protein